MANTPITTGTSYCVVTDHDPGVLDSDYGQQTFWFNSTSGALWWSVDLTPDNAVWKEVTLT
jgi:hypothetical protein